MPVFISYSHENNDFVQKLATNLIRHNTNVWVDTWELSVGDSIVSQKDAGDIHRLSNSILGLLI